MASKVTFFTPGDPLDINTLLGLEGSAQWIHQTNNPSKSADRAQGLAANGDEAAWKSHNAKTAGQVVYECFAASGFLTLPGVGIIAGGFHGDNVKLDYNTVGWPRLTVAVHKHDGASSHDDAEGGPICNTFATSLKWPAGFGVPAVITDLATPAVKQFEMKAAAVGMKTLGYTLSCTHVDETGGTGDWLAGDNRDGVEQIDAEMTGVPEDTDLVIDASWHRATDGSPEGNTAANARKVSISRHVEREAA